MPFCIKCGSAILPGSNFCHNCGNSTVVDAETYTAPENGFANGYVYNEINYGSSADNQPVYTSTEDERQHVVDKFRKKLNGERIFWKIFGILNIVSPIMCLFGIVISSFMMTTIENAENTSYLYESAGICYEYNADQMDDEYGSEDIMILDNLMGFVYAYCCLNLFVGIYYRLPAGIVSLIRGTKVGNCMDKLYTDCSIALERCMSPSVIVFSAIFNPMTLIFSIQAFCFARKNKQVLLETADIQKKYFGNR